MAKPKPVEIPAVLSYRGANRVRVRAIQHFLHGYEVPWFDPDGQMVERPPRRLRVCNDSTDLVGGQDLDESLEKLVRLGDFLLLACTPEMARGVSRGQRNHAMDEYRSWKEQERRGRVAQNRVLLLWISGLWKTPEDNPDDGAKPAWLEAPECNAIAFSFKDGWREARIGIAARMAGLATTGLDSLRRRDEKKARSRRRSVAIITFLGLGIFAWLALSNYFLARNLDRELTRSRAFARDVLTQAAERLAPLHGSVTAVQYLLAAAERQLLELEDASAASGAGTEIARDIASCRLVVAFLCYESGDARQCLHYANQIAAAAEAAHAKPGDTSPAYRSWVAETKAQAMILAASAAARLGDYSGATEYADRASAAVVDRGVSDATRSILDASIDDARGVIAIATDKDHEGWKQARENWRRARDLLAPLLDADPLPVMLICPSVRRAFGVMNRKVAEAEIVLFDDTGDEATLARALDSIGQSRDALQRLVDDSPPDRPTLVELTTTMSTFAAFEARQGDRLQNAVKTPEGDPRLSPEAQEWYALAADHAALAVEGARTLVLLNPDSPGLVRELATAYLTKGRIARAQLRLDLARECLEKVIEEVDPIAEESGLSELKGHRVTAREYLAYVEIDVATASEGEVREAAIRRAVTRADEAIELLAKLESKDVPATSRHLEELRQLRDSWKLALGQH